MAGATLNEELDRIFAARDRDDMQPTIDALLPFYAAHPENARVLYELAGASTRLARRKLRRDSTKPHSRLAWKVTCFAGATSSTGRR